MPAHFFTHQSERIAYDDAGASPLVICAPSLGDLRAAVHRIEGAGHYPHAEAPEATALHVLLFLAPVHPVRDVHYAA